MIRDKKRISTEGNQVNVTEDAKVSIAFINRVANGDFAGGRCQSIDKEDLGGSN